MSNHDFGEMRDLLLLLYANESISEFLILYESYSSENPEFSYSCQMDKSGRLAEFRVKKQEIPLLANVLQIPVTVRYPQRITRS